MMVFTWKPRASMASMTSLGPSLEVSNLTRPLSVFRATETESTPGTLEREDSI